MAHLFWWATMIYLWNMLMFNSYATSSQRANRYKDSPKYVQIDLDSHLEDKRWRVPAVHGWLGGHPTYLEPGNQFPVGLYLRKTQGWKWVLWKPLLGNPHSWRKTTSSNCCMKIPLKFRLGPSSASCISTHGVSTSAGERMWLRVPNHEVCRQRHRRGKRTAQDTAPLHHTPRRPWQPAFFEAKLGDWRSPRSPPWTFVKCPIIPLKDTESPWPWHSLSHRVRCWDSWVSRHEGKPGHARMNPPQPSQCSEFVWFCMNLSWFIIYDLLSIIDLHGWCFLCTWSCQCQMCHSWMISVKGLERS